MVTKIEFIAEKLKNLRTYLKEAVKVEEEDLKKLDPIIADPHSLVPLVRTFIKPHESDLDKALESLIVQLEMTKYTLEDDHRAKLKRYITCFLSVC